MGKEGKMKHGLVIRAAIVVVLGLAIWITGVRVIVIQPIGTLPEGVAAIGCCGGEGRHDPLPAPLQRDAIQANWRAVPVRLRW